MLKQLQHPVSDDKGASLPSDSDVSLPASMFDTVLSNSDGADQEQSTGLKLDTTFSNGIESDSSKECTITTHKKKQGEEIEKVSACILSRNLKVKFK